MSLASLFICLSLAAAPISGEQEKAATPFRGVWEQVGFENNLGKWEEKFEQKYRRVRVFMVNEGIRSCWVGSLVSGVRLVDHEIRFPSEGKGMLDFSDFNNNRTLRTKYEFTSTSLRICWNSRGRPDLRPLAIQPTDDGFSVHTFRKLEAPPPLEGVAASGNWLSGIWRTVGASVDGEPLEGKANDIPFAKMQNAYYFLDDMCFVFVSDRNEYGVRRQRYRFRPDIGKDAIDFVEGKKVIAARFAQDGDSMRIAWSDSGERPKSVDPVVGNKVASLSRLFPGKKANP